jgi:flagellar motor switch protein FliM
MITAADNNLSKDKIQQLLAAVGKSTSQAADINPDAKDYNWRAAKFFSSEQLKKIEEFAAKITENIAANFQKLFFYNFEVKVSSVSQHNAGEFTQPGGSIKYYLAFGGKDQPAGIFVMPSQTANIWASQLLGSSSADSAAEKELSQLELSLLLDVAAAAIGAVSAAYAQTQFAPIGEVSQKFPLELEPIQDICKVGLNIRKADADKTNEAFILFLSDKITAVAGQSKADNIPQQNITKALMEHLQSIPVQMTVRLAGATLNLQQLMAIEPDDTILLDKKITEPIDVLCNDQVIFRARPARADANYAVVITESSNNKNNQRL